MSPELLVSCMSQSEMPQKIMSACTTVWLYREAHGQNNLNPGLVSAKCQNAQSFFICLVYFGCSLQVILSLTNNWNSTSSVDQFVSWSPTAHVHEDFFNDPTCMQLYQQYAAAIINRVNYINGRRCTPTVLLPLFMMYVYM